MLDIIISHQPRCPLSLLLSRRGRTFQNKFLLALETLKSLNLFALKNMFK